MLAKLENTNIIPVSKRKIVKSVFSVSRAEWVDLSVNPNFFMFHGRCQPSHSPSCLHLNKEPKGEDIFGNPTVLVSHTQKYFERKILRGSMDKEDNKRAFTSFMFRNRSRIFNYQS